jgi:hypothetical protein
MTRDEMFKNRLLDLCDLLVKLPKNRFDYESYVGPDWQGKSNLSCGTTACAFGWATTIPKLRRAGLRLINTDRYGGTRGVVTTQKIGDSPGSDIAAAEEIFNLDYNEFEYLFIPYGITSLPDLGLYDEYHNSDMTAKELSKHIRKFVKAKYGSDRK